MCLLYLFGSRFGFGIGGSGVAEREVAGSGVVGSGDAGSGVPESGRGFLRPLSIILYSTYSASDFHMGDSLFASQLSS